MLNQFQSRQIQPLQIIKEQHERMLCPSEYAEESSEHRLKTPLLFLWREFWDRWLFSDHELQLRDKVNDKLTVRAERLAHGIPPPAKLPHFGPATSGQGSGRLGPGWRTGCRACIGQ